MAFSDPQSVTIGTVPGAVSLPRVYSTTEQGRFQNLDSKVVLMAGTSYNRRTRNAARLEFSKVTADPLVSTTNILVKAGVTVSIDMPPSGFSASEKKDMALALINWLTASTNANLIKLIAGES